MGLSAEGACLEGSTEYTIALAMILSSYSEINDFSYLSHWIAFSFYLALDAFGWSIITSA
jgi:hypothetical protein